LTFVNWSQKEKSIFSPAVHGSAAHHSEAIVAGDSNLSVLTS
jgi:hypothetical protein